MCIVENRIILVIIQLIGRIIKGGIQKHARKYDEIAVKFLCCVFSSFANLCCVIVINMTRKNTDVQSVVGHAGAPLVTAFAVV